MGSKVGLLSLCLALAACSADPRPESTQQAPGEPLPALVGTWELTSGGESILDLRADGSVVIESVANTPGGPIESTAEGQWWADDITLSIQREGPNGLFAAGYAYELGENLSLIREGRSEIQVYQRQDDGDPVSQ